MVANTFVMVCYTKLFVKGNHDMVHCVCNFLWWEHTRISEWAITSTLYYILLCHETTQVGLPIWPFDFIHTHSKATVISSLQHVQPLDGSSSFMADSELLQAEILGIIDGLTYVFKVGYACSPMLFNKRRGMFRVEAYLWTNAIYGSVIDWIVLCLISLYQRISLKPLPACCSKGSCIDKCWIWKLLQQCDCLYPKILMDHRFNR